MPRRVGPLVAARSRLLDEAGERSVRVLDALAFEHCRRGWRRLLALAYGAKRGTHDHEGGNGVQRQQHPQHYPALKNERDYSRNHDTGCPNDHEKQPRAVDLRRSGVGAVAHGPLDVQVGAVDRLVTDRFTRLVDQGLLGPLAWLVAHLQPLPGTAALNLCPGALTKQKQSQRGLANAVPIPVMPTEVAL